ncbi:cyclin-dependent kinase 2-interacting protein [Scleropages formosus]|uniref:Cyclin dependent kinase 2 interacting protein n=1 Tax=Scleropages formosus TaxID=113540 RepID=A0A8C9RPY2_SCLFO|nr:cyclin-dependent kinase 2-interacting protein [Scleropages formosus]
MKSAGKERMVESECAPASGRKQMFTGSARKLRDTAADWHNLMLKWERLGDEGSAAATRIVNLSVSKRAEKDVDITAEDDTSFVNERSGSHAELDKDLQDGCNELMNILEKMAHIVFKMEKISSSVKGVCALEKFQQEQGRSSVSPLFQTWPVTRFDEVSSKLYESYKQELALKQTIVKEIAHTSDPDLLLVYLSSWLHQPYIEDNTKLLLESLLLETMHRTL